MILGFKKQFVTPIKKGTKIHSIRIDKHNRWKAGRSIQMATGVRTKNYKCFLKKHSCISVQRIEIRYEKNHIILVFVDGRKLNFMEVLALARNDGFKSLYDFFEWFSKDFVGKIVHWTNKKY